MSYIAKQSIAIRFGKTSLKQLKDAVRIAVAAARGHLPMDGHDDFEHAWLMGWVEVRCREGLDWTTRYCETADRRSDGEKEWSSRDRDCKLIKAGPVWTKVRCYGESFRVRTADIGSVTVEFEVD